MITANLTEPIYIAVTGVVSSVYTLSTSAVHVDHPLSSALTLAQDI